MLARALVPEARDGGTIVIDATPYSREQGAPLVLPEVNAVAREEPRRAIACSRYPDRMASASAVALAPLHEAATVKRVVTTVFESAAIRGREAMDELSQQSVKLMQGRGFDHDEFPEQLAFNVRPQAAALDGQRDGRSTSAGWRARSRRCSRRRRCRSPRRWSGCRCSPGAAQSVFVELERPLERRGGAAS